MLACPDATARLDEIGWIPDHLRDLAADFRVFYGITSPLGDLPGPEFFALAWRTPAYGGAMTARVRAVAAPEPAGGTLAPPDRYEAVQGRPPADGDRIDVVPAEALLTDPAFAGIASRGQA